MATETIDGYSVIITAIEDKIIVRNDSVWIIWNNNERCARIFRGDILQFVLCKDNIRIITRGLDFTLPFGKSISLKDETKTNVLKHLMGKIYGQP